MATHSSIFAWRISWTEEPGQATVRGVAELGTTERLMPCVSFGPRGLPGLPRGTELPGQP